MNTHALPTACLALLLAGCAATDWPQENFGSPSGGYVKTVKVEPPPDMCDGDAYINGYRSGYMLTWNQAIASRMEPYRAGAKKTPPDPKAKAAFDFYQGKLFDMQAVNQKETRYTYVPSSTECEFHSYNQGKARGNKDVVRDLDALWQQAPK